MKSGSEYETIIRQSFSTLFGGLIASSLSMCVLNWYLIVTNASSIAPFKKNFEDDKQLR